MKQILISFFALGVVSALCSCNKSKTVVALPHDRDTYFSCLVKDIRTVVAATTDDEGKPVTMAIDLMLYDSEGLYFTTFVDKAFYAMLNKDGYISLTGIKGEDTLSRFAISIHGKVREAGQDKLSKIFEAAPYMKEILSLNDKQETHIRVFQIYEGSGQLYSQKPRKTAFFAF
jgi:uncharacterized pyridoxamine 5'-phosphate oxidase family protein